MIFDKITALGNYVLLEAKEDKAKEVTLDSGLVLAADVAHTADSGQKLNAKGGKVKVRPPVITSIGPKVDPELGLKVGDTVLYNDYDAQTFTDDNGEIIYVLIKDSQIKGVASLKD